MTSRVSFAEFVWVWNLAQGQTMPSVHRRIADWLDARWEAGDRRLLLMAFRACGKSTMVGLFCGWLLLQDSNLRILVLAAEEALAGKMVRFVKRVVERHPLTRHLRPQRPEQWGADRFTVVRTQELRDPSIIARGLAGNLTGSRADVVICDDVEVPNTCDTAPKREDLRTRLSEIDYVLTPDGLQLYAGTPHSFYTIYAAQPRPELGEEQPFLVGFQRLELPIVDAQGRPAWPERYGPDVIGNLRRRHGPNKFQSQMLLKPVSLSGGRLDPDALRLYDKDLQLEQRNGRTVLLLGGREMISATCWWDPAYGLSEKADRSVIACVFSDRDGYYWLHRVAYLQVTSSADTDEARQQCQAVARFLADNHLPSISIEVNGLGRFLPGLLRTVLRERGVPAAIVERHSRKSKDLRILESFDAVLAAGHLMVHRAVWQTPLITEMRDWRPGVKRAGVDDGLDAVAGCLASEPVRLRADPIESGRQPSWSALGQPISVESDFNV